jgi:hypothetical protein
MIVTLNLLTGAFITVLSIITAHVIFRLARVELGSVFFRILRYVAGEIAILAGLSQVMDVHAIAILLGFMAIAGVSTVFCYLLFDRIDDRPRLTSRAETAEDALDDQS